jgi:hypothetical protein
MPYTDRLTTNTLPRWAVNKFVVTLHFQHLKHQASRHNPKDNDTNLKQKKAQSLKSYQLDTKTTQSKRLNMITAHEQKNRNQTSNKTENPNHSTNEKFNQTITF